MSLPNLVSRKKDFIPMLTSTVTAGFVPSASALQKTAEQKSVNSVEEYGIVTKEYSADKCCAVLVRRPSVALQAVEPGRARRASAFAGMAVPGGGWANVTASPKVEQREMPAAAAAAGTHEVRVVEGGDGEEEEEEDEEDEEEEEEGEGEEEKKLESHLFPGSHRKMVLALKKISKVYDADTSEYMKNVATPLLTALTTALLRGKPAQGGEMEAFVAEYAKSGAWK